MPGNPSPKYRGTLHVTGGTAEDALIVTEAEAPQPAARVPPAFVALVAPDVGMKQQALTGRVRHAFAVAWICSILAGAAAAYRVDTRRTTMQQLEKSGQVATMSDRQIDDEVKGAEKKFIVLTTGIKAVQPPFFLLLTALCLVTLGWFLRGKIQGKAVFPVAAAALLPGAIANLIDAVTIFRRPMISPDDASLIPRTVTDILAAVGHPLNGAFAKLGNVLDFYSLWTAILVGFGLAACTTVPTRRALIGTLVAWFCVRLLTNVAMGGGHP